jgi:hypothetical protein
MIPEMDWPSLPTSGMDCDTPAGSVSQWGSMISMDDGSAITDHHARFSTDARGAGVLGVKPGTHGGSTILGSEFASALDLGGFKGRPFGAGSSGVGISYADSSPPAPMGTAAVSQIPSGAIERRSGENLASCGYPASGEQAVSLSSSSTNATVGMLLQQQQQQQQRQVSETTVLSSFSEEDYMNPNKELSMAGVSYLEGLGMGMGMGMVGGMDMTMSLGGMGMGINLEQAFMEDDDGMSMMVQDESYRAGGTGSSGWPGDEDDVFVRCPI